MKKHLISIPFLSALGRSAGMLIPFFVAWAYGAGRHTDIFFVVFSLMTFIANVMAYLFESVLVPYLSEQKIRSGSADHFANGVLWGVLPGVTLLCLVLGGLIYTGALPGIIKPGDAADAGRLFFEMLPFLIFGIAAAQSNGLFYVHQMFLFPALSPLFRSLIVLIFIFTLKSRIGIHALVAGYVAGEGLRWIAGLWILKQSIGWKPAVDWQKSGADILQFFRKMAYQLIALIALNIVFFTDLLFASRLGEGSVSLLNYADRMYQIPYLFFQQGFLQIFHSYWSERFHREPAPVFWARTYQDIWKIIAVSAGISFLLWNLRGILTTLAFGHQHFSAEQLKVVQDLFALLMVSLAPSILFMVYVRILLVLKKTWFYASVACLYLGLKIAFNFLLIGSFGVRGLSLSTCLAVTLLAGGLHVYIRKKSSEAGAS